MANATDAASRFYAELATVRPERGPSERCGVAEVLVGPSGEVVPAGAPKTKLPPLRCGRSPS